MQDLGHMDWDDANNGCRNYSFCDNLKGTLPSREQLLTMYRNKSSLESLLTTNGGKKFSTESHYWSSTPYYGGYDSAYYFVNMSNGDYWDYGYSGWYDGYDGDVRPVLVNY